MTCPRSSAASWVKGFVQQCVGEADLAEIVEHARQHQLLQRRVVEFQDPSDCPGDIRDPLAVAGENAAARLDELGKDSHRREVGLAQLLMREVGALEGHRQGFRSFVHARLEIGVEHSQLLVLPLRQLGEAPVVGLQPTQRQRIGYRQPQRLVIPGLGHIAIDLALVDRRNRGLNIGVAGQQNAQRIGRDPLTRVRNSAPSIPGMRMSEITRSTVSAATSSSPRRRFPRSVSGNPRA